MAKTRQAESEFAEATTYDSDRVSVLEMSNGNGPYGDVTLKLRGHPVQWNEARGELTIGVPVVYNKNIRESMDDLVGLAMPNADKADQNRITENLLETLYREQVRVAIMALVKD